MTASSNHDPRAFAVTMGMDAFRIAIGIPPRTHALEDIIRWLALMAAKIGTSS